MSLGRNPKDFALCTLAGDDKVLDLERVDLFVLFVQLGSAKSLIPPPSPSKLEYERQSDATWPAPPSFYR
jgi:hypothetical protein